MTKRVLFVTLLLALVMALVACGGTAAPAATPETVEVPVEVTRIVEVEGTPQVQTETIVVTATPDPNAPVPEAEGEGEGTMMESPHPDTIIVATIGGPETFDPALAYETAGAEVLQNVYDTLVVANQGNASEFVPSLAESYEISDDGLTYTFTIREGVTFHEGGELTAEDVAYSFQRGILQGGPSSPQFLLTEPLYGIGIYDVTDLINPDGSLSGDVDAVKATDAAQLAEVCETVKAAVVADGKTVTFTLAQPYGPFLATFVGNWGAVMDKEWVVENGGWDGECGTWQDFYGISSENDPFTAIANGTGPFKLERWTQGEEIVLAANEDYWRTEDVGSAWEGGPVGPPAISRVVIQSVDEWGTRFAMMQAGDADTVNVPIENRPQIDPLVGEICTYQQADGEQFECAPSEANPDGPFRMFTNLPSVTRSDAMFTFDINVEGGNNLIGSGQLDGNGIPANFFSDINVRRGFNYCFDHETFNAEVYQGEAVQNVGFLIPGMLGYDESGPMYTYDPEKCGEELAAAHGGVLPELGFRFQIGYNTGNTTRQTVGEILQASLSEVNELYQVEVIGLPWANFLRQQREARLPIFISGWHEDIHDPHNWAQPFLVGTYGARQVLPEDLLAQLGEKVDAAVAATDPEERAAIYAELTQMDYDNALAIRLATATGRSYWQRWVSGWYYNEGYPGHYYYPLSVNSAEAE